MVIVSPGVYTFEKDLSLYAPELATAIFGVVTTASKGPINIPTLITDKGTLDAVFGPPSVIHMGLHAATEYLKQGNQLWVVRVSTYDQEALPFNIPNAAGTFDTLRVHILSSGSWGNTVSVAVAASAVAGRYRIAVLDGGKVVELFDNLLIGAVYATDPNYILNRIIGSASAYIWVEVLDDTQTDLQIGPYAFIGGDDGAPADTADIIGSIGSPPVVPATGLQLFRNPETMDLNLLAVPGNTDHAVIAELIDICESRADCMALLAVPYGKTVQEAVAWANGLGGGPDDPTASLDTSYAALFYPWVKVYDSLADSDIWISPEGHAARVIAYSDKVADPWGAPAGFNRGILNDVLEIEHSATQGERDYMYGPGNNVNPIVNFAGHGFVLWGQKTLQRTSTALDRINVRRMLLYARKIIATAVLSLVHEPNDSRTWRRFVNLTEPICQDIKSRRGLYDFRVICDATTNTPLVVDRNQMKGRILMQPTRTAEMISIEFALLPTGASFSEA